MTTYTVRFADKLEIKENSDKTFGLSTRWLGLNLYKGADHISHHFDKPLLKSMIEEFDIKGGFTKTVGYSLDKIKNLNDPIVIKFNRKLVWSLQHMYKAPKNPYIGKYDSKKIAEVKSRLLMSKDNLIILFSLELTKKVNKSKSYLEIRVVGFSVSTLTNPNLTIYSYNMNPMTVIKFSDINNQVVKEAVNKITFVKEKPYVSITPNEHDILQLTESQWAHSWSKPMTSIRMTNIQKCYRELTNLLDNKKVVYYADKLVEDVAILTYRKGEQSIYILDDVGDIVERAENLSKFSVLTPITF